MLCEAPNVPEVRAMVPLSAVADRCARRGSGSRRCSRRTGWSTCPPSSTPPQPSRTTSNSECVAPPAAVCADPPARWSGHLCADSLQRWLGPHGAAVRPLASAHWYRANQHAQHPLTPAAPARQTLSSAPSTASCCWWRRRQAARTHARAHRRALVAHPRPRRAVALLRSQVSLALRGPPPP
jgi:hypothetical protein